MKLKTFVSVTTAMSLVASLVWTATPARAGQDGDNGDRGVGDARGHDQDQDQDHDGGHHGRKPRVVMISLDGAKPDFIQKFIEEGVLPRDGGLARLSRRGAVALQNVTASPSLTAVSHIAIATGSTAVHNDIPSNTFEPIVGPISGSISGFAAPIGGYSENPLGPSPHPTAVPLWVQLRQQGKKVVTATWPGGDGADISINKTVVQPAQPTRITDFTVPFGAFGGIGAQGFSLSRGDFTADPSIVTALQAAGHFSFSPVLVTSAPIETFSCSAAATATCTNASTLDVKYSIRVAAIDTTNDRKVNYDTLVFFDANRGITAGPFHAPSTGPAYVKFGGENAPFFFEGSGAKVGAAYFVSALSPDLSVVRFARYGANYIPRNTPVLADVDDINNNIGFWRPQADFRIPERLSPGFTSFSDVEFETMFEDMVKTFVRYQANIGERAIKTHPDADLVMVYIEQPDGSEHQFLLTDPRQGTNPTDPNSIGANQDAAKVKRYASYIRFAYQTADKAVKQIADAAGRDSNVIVVSDHGFAPFHTSVNLTNILRNAGIDTSKVGIRTSGPAADIYINLQNRELGGTVDLATYRTLVAQITDAVKNAVDPNARFNYSLKDQRIFTVVETRPLQCDAGTGQCISKTIGQDYGDVFALMAPGYNFDGIQNPGVARQGDAPFNAATTMLSMPNFHGAHGHDPELPVMSATFIAAGPQIRKDTVVRHMRNIDVAPTIMRILGSAPQQVDGEVLGQVLR
ncbi:putative AlkP superfamily pyrophosphatase or phosphodiesterase [Bradyrhizobium sp. USDA 4532]|uniref:alkaline phosphatase family protein n=1 Tax=unclassified Bradyrhizobium TaxID=2631580 RepID=UPI0020A110AD|nr:MULTISPECIES: alkaline phosphatase family protein [unclassified Bradyrhizobium]MCP1831997.1 putative AlkP superfamily pyrophosphatase or phosphodiesterase [Bradyrhizobium sp. USDA 4545]MCP1916833.1 putative AlkP superfamily pyrophosphatase or phosphodiesterase [Bradyrhizobium sp. USDA 4532]